MSDVTVLPVQARERAGKGAARATRRQGLVPGVIYGAKQPPTLVAMDPRPLIAEMRRTGFYARQFDVELDGAKHRVMVQDVQFHVVMDHPIHVDFLRIGKDTRVTAEVPVEFTGQDRSPGLKRGGVLNVVRHEIEVHAKPDDLPAKITCDLSGLDINESLHISSVTLPAGVTPTITDRDFTIATIVAPSGIKAEADEAEGEGEAG